MREASTLAQFQWQFRDMSLWAGEYHSPAGGVHAVVGVLRTLGVFDMEIGPGVSVRNNYDLSRLVDGTILYHGAVTDPRRYAVVAWRKRQGMIRLLGNGRADPPWTIDVMPDHERPAWLDVPPAEDETERIMQFKKEAWRVGYEEKVRRGWCGTFEQVMSQMEIYR